MAEQHKLEQYVESVRRAFGAAQADADRRQHVRVTVDHLLAAMLEAGMGEDPCKRAGVEIKSLLGKATAALDALPKNATELAFLDAELLATMGRAEAVAKQLGAPLVDIQCMYVAFGARKHLPTMIGLGKWSDTERIGSVPPAAVPVTKEPTLSATLNDAAAALAGLGAQIAAACGVPIPPAEVKATFERILIAFDQEWTPFLTLDWRKRGDAPPKDFHQALVATRGGCEGRSVVLTWAAPATMVLETTDQNGIQSVPFELTPSRRWVNGERELFGALRAAILGLYAEVVAVQVPAPAKIDAYVVADGIGTLKLATGQQLRFGRSACKGFEPIVGASVIVETISEDARGLRATSMGLDASDKGYDALLAARDAALGVVTSSEKSADNARALGLMTILLKEPLPRGTLALRDWAAGLGFPKEGFEVRTEHGLEFASSGGPFVVYPGSEPFPSEGLDTRHIPDGFSFGKSFLGFGGDLPGLARSLRALRGGGTDVWAQQGKVRQLSRLIRALAPHATGVILHRAGEAVLAIDDFLPLLGDLDNPECVPFAAWLDVAKVDIGGPYACRSFGMDAFGLPDVELRLAAETPWAWSRAREAVLYTCYRMVRENREIPVGESVDVPLYIRVGAWTLDLNRKVSVERYTTAEVDGMLQLVPTAEGDPFASWQESRSSIAVNRYQALFSSALDAALDLVRVAEPSGPVETLHSLEVRARRDGRGVMVISNGYGLAPQHDADDEYEHVELAAWVPGDDRPYVQRLVGSLGSYVQDSASGAWKPADTLAMAVEELGIGGFVLADGGAIEMGKGPDIRLLLLVPVSPDEYERVRGGGVASWLETHEVDEHAWDRFLSAEQ